MRLSISRWFFFLRLCFLCYHISLGLPVSSISTVREKEKIRYKYITILSCSREGLPNSHLFASDLVLLFQKQIYVLCAVFTNPHLSQTLQLWSSERRSYSIFRGKTKMNVSQDWREKKLFYKSERIEFIRGAT